MRLILPGERTIMVCSPLMYGCKRSNGVSPVLDMSTDCIGSLLIDYGLLVNPFISSVSWIVWGTIIPEDFVKPQFRFSSVWHRRIPGVFGVGFTFHKSPVNGCYKVFLQHRHYRCKSTVTWTCHILGAQQRTTVRL